MYSMCQALAVLCLAWVLDLIATLRLCTNGGANRTSGSMCAEVLAYLHGLLRALCDQMCGKVCIFILDS